MKNLKNKFAFPLLLCTIGLGTLSCISEQDDILEDETTLASRSAKDFLFYDDFENGNPFSKAHGKELGANHSVKSVAAPGRSNTKAARFELNDNDPTVKGSKRAEITIINDDVEKDIWYGFDLFVPNDYKDESDDEVINQWHQSGNASASIRIKDGRFLWRTFINGDRKDFDLGKIAKGTWNNFVIHKVHSYGSDGITELWLNNKQILDLKGRNINNDDLPKWKIGIYKSEWASKKTTVKKRVLYFDNVKVGDKTTTLNNMTSSAPTTNTSTTTDSNDSGFSESSGDFGNSLIKGLTFVNTEINKDIYPLADGGSVSLQREGTFKISVRADVSSSDVQSVKFELSGAQNHTYVDKAKPFALFGDNGNGNYYYGLGMKEGNYKLKITTYSEPKAAGGLIGVETVNFSIKK